MMLLHVLTSGPVTPAGVWRSWRAEPAVLALVALTALWYGAGVWRLWAHAGARRVITTWRAWAFAAGIATLLAALCSPLDAVADTLFFAHMLQHVLLITVAAPLLVAGIPALALVWALPDAWRGRFGRAWNASGLARVGRAATRPGSAWTLHVAALWLWHVPGPYGAALASPALHALEHLCFLGTAMLVWQVALRPLGQRRDDTAWGLAVLFGTFVQSGALGALLAFSTTPWYYAQSVGAGAWHLTALEDQQLAGLIMWIPAGFIYLGAMLALMRRWFVTPVRAAAAGAALVVLGACGGHRESRRVPDGNARRGRVSIAHYGCGSCHDIPGISQATGTVGPPLGGIADRRVIAGELPNTPDELVRWIVMPQSVEPGTAMPNMGVSDGEARDIAAYLYTLH